MINCTSEAAIHPQNSVYKGVLLIYLHMVLTSERAITLIPVQKGVIAHSLVKTTAMIMFGL